MRLNRWVLLWLLVIAVLIAVEVAIVAGYIRPTDLVGSFFTFVFALLVISILSLIGAVFLGIFVSHRILSAKGFTPFEQEMLRMRQEVRELSDRVEQIGMKLGLALGNRKKEP